MKILTGLFPLLILTGCSLTGKAAPLQYFTLKSINNSCFGTVQVDGPAYLLSENIVVRKGFHEIGSVPSSYWIAPLRELITISLSGPESTSSLSIDFEELSLQLTTNQIELTANTEVCSQDKCNQRLIQKHVPAVSETSIDIIKSYQTALEELSKELCP